MSIIVKTLSYTHPDRISLFSDISFSVAEGSKAALVGNNGTGKSTLLRIVAQELSPSSGEVLLQGKVCYIPQHTGQYDDYTVAQALRVDRKLEALHSILQGDASLSVFTALDDDWNIEERIKLALSHWGIGHLQTGQPMKHLSGGEKTKVFLASILVHSPQIILLDEPSNHLDLQSREMLYAFVEKSKSTILCVSHDRTLLNLFDTTLELSRKSIETFGGNYEFYKEEKEKQVKALQNAVNEKDKAIRQTVRKSREIAEKRQKQESRGKAGSRKKALPRIVANSLQSKAEQSSAKMKEIQSGKIRSLSEDLRNVKEQLSEQAVLTIDLKTSELHRGKILIEGKDVNYSYDGQTPLWENPQTFIIRSGERISIEGGNGAGKTTLVKMLTGDLKPSSGELSLADFQHLYIDQEYSAIERSLSLFEQIQRFNDRLLPEHELKMLLHVHNFPKETWDKKCSLLSGGEKMKLILCCVATNSNAPDMIILDEPTNNLDITSQKMLTAALKGYNGTLVLISHDRYFKNEAGIDRALSL